MVASLITSSYVSVDRVWKLFNFFPFFAKWVGKVLTGLPMPAVLLRVPRLIHILRSVSVSSHPSYSSLRQA